MFNISIKKTNAIRILIFVLLFLYAFSLIYTLVWGAVSSFKDPIEYIVNKAKFFPESFLFSNYLDAFDLLKVGEKNLINMIINSIWLTLGQSLVSMAVCCTTAYIIAKYDFVGKKVITFVIYASMLIPLYGSMSALLKLYLKIGLYDSPFILLASASGIGAMHLILKSYFANVSWEYAEAAEIDGANDLYIYLKIMLPIAFPAISSIFLVMVINGWNDYATSIYYLPSYPTVASGLYLYKTKASFNMNYPVYFAGVMLSCIPTFILFLMFQEKIMSSITTGGLKG